MEKTYRTINGQSNRKIGFKTIQRDIVALLFLMVLIGCSKDSGENEPNPPDPTGLEGSLKEVRDFYNDALVDAMLELDFKINPGSNPPDLEGSYVISPFVMEASSVEAEADLIGMAFKDYVTTFSNQDNETLTIDYMGQGALEVDNGTGSFIMGANGAFTVYAKAISQIGSTPSDIAVAVSGTLTTDGIKDAQIFGAMIDDHGDPDNVYIANNEGRVFIDGDGLASPQGSESGKQSEAQPIGDTVTWGFGTYYPN